MLYSIRRSVQNYYPSPMRAIVVEVVRIGRIGSGICISSDSLVYFHFVLEL